MMDGGLDGGAEHGSRLDRERWNRGGDLSGGLYYSKERERKTEGEEIGKVEEEGRNRGEEE